MTRSLRRGLKRNLRKQGLRIATEVPNDGNCFFHSMVHLGYGDSARTLRIALANVMFMLGTVKGVFSNQPNVSLRDLFSMCNEISTVYDVRKRWRLRAYTYTRMCRDMRTSGSWMRLPMNLMMHVLSWLFNAEFIITTSTRGQPPLRIVWNDARTSYVHTIRLGKLGELHYLPLCTDDRTD